jgi:hypothetical protein
MDDMRENRGERRTLFMDHISSTVPLPSWFGFYFSRACLVFSLLLGASLPRLHTPINSNRLAFDVFGPYPKSHEPNYFLLRSRDWKFVPTLR